MCLLPMLCSSARGPKHLSCASGRVRVHGPEVGEGVPVWKSNDSAEGVHGASAVLAKRRLLKANAIERTDTSGTHSADGVQQVRTGCVPERTAASLSEASSHGLT